MGRMECDNSALMLVLLYINYQVPLIYYFKVMSHLLLPFCDTYKFQVQMKRELKQFPRPSGTLKENTNYLRCVIISLSASHGPGIGICV